MRVAEVTIDGVTYDMGDGLKSMVMSSEYGFNAAGLTATFDFEAVHGKQPDVLRRGWRERVKVDAIMVFEDGRSENFSGFLDDNTGEDEVFGEDPAELQLSARSVLALLIDDDGSPDARVTKTFFNADWSEVVRHMVKSRGFKAHRIEPAGKPFAGERDSAGRYMLVVDDQLPSEVITQAVSATGFVANTRPDREFYFVRSVRPPWMIDDELVFVKQDPESTIASYRYANGRVNRITTRKRLVKIDPGMSVGLSIQFGRGDYATLSGKYWVSGAEYFANEVPGDNNNYSAFTVAEELPRLKAEEG